MSDQSVADRTLATLTGAIWPEADIRYCLLDVEVAEGKGRIISTIGVEADSLKYDDASWHSGGQFPEDLSSSAAATHAGMFLAWAILNGLGSEVHAGGPALRDRTATPGAYFLHQCDGKLTDEDLTPLGQAFAAAYFSLEDGQYIHDYVELLCSEHATPYHAADTWATYAVIEHRIAERYKAFASTVR